MPESNTRKWWRARLEGFAMDTVARNNAGHVSDTEGWLDDFMQTPELSLADLAESNPNYRLAVVDKASITQERVWDDKFEYAYAPVARVVKMEER